MTNFNTQVGGGVYHLQFETDNRLYYEAMQRTARLFVDNSNLETTTPSGWISVMDRLPEPPKEE